MDPDPGCWSELEDEVLEAVEAAASLVGAGAVAVAVAVELVASGSGVATAAGAVAAVEVAWWWDARCLWAAAQLAPTATDPCRFECGATRALPESTLPKRRGAAGPTCDASGEAPTEAVTGPPPVRRPPP